MSAVIQILDPPFEEPKKDPLSDVFKTWFTIGCEMSEMRRKGVMCDVKLAPSGENVKQRYIVAHSVILAASSKFFYKYFVQSRGCQMDSSDIVQLTNVADDVLTTTVDFIYGKLPTTDEEMDVLAKGAELLGVESAKKFIRSSRKGKCCFIINRILFVASLDYRNVDYFFKGDDDSEDDEVTDSGKKPGHNEDSMLSCTECGKLYYSPKTLGSHMWYAHKIACRDTDEVDAYEGVKDKSVADMELMRLQQQQMSQNSKTLPLKCMYCIQRFATYYDYVTHMENFHDHSRFYLCCLCSRTFRHNPTIVYHFKKAHNINTNYLTLKSLQVILTQLNKLGHSLVVPPQYQTGTIDRFRCPQCQQVHSHLSDLEIDVRKHIADLGSSAKSKEPDLEEYECHECGSMFKNMKFLDEHCNMIHFHRFICKHCGQHFASTTHLASHVKLHSAAKNCVCETCGRKFRYMSSLRTHRLLHSDELKYQCKLCPKKFRFSQGLRYHEHTYHSANDDYQSRHSCEFCEFTTAQKTQLEIHRRRHTGERPFKCDFCGKSYMAKKHLRKHQQIHLKQPKTEEEPVGLDYYNDCLYNLYNII